MDGDNPAVLFSIISLAVCIAGYAILGCIQAVETWERRHDDIRTFRAILLATLTVTLAGMVPTLMYQISRYYGIESEALRNFANVSSQVSRLSTLTGFCLLYYNALKRRN